jgi:hypothetical protein
MLKELEDILRINYERKFLLDISAILRVALPNCRLEEKMTQHCKQRKTKNAN